MAEIRSDDLRRVGWGREAEVFAWGEGRVLRVARTVELGEAIERERAALEAAQRCGAPVPAVYDRVDVDGRPGLVLERLEQPDLLSGVLRRPWTLAAVPDVLARLQAALHETPAPPELPDLRAAIAARLRSDHVPSRVRDPALGALERLPDGDRLCHGDFHPGNVLRRGDGYAVVDWKNAARGDPAADIAWTRLLLVGAWIPGLGPRWAQLPLAAPRLALYVAYRRAYDRRRPLERGAVAAWVPVLAAARLSADISQERRRLLAIARRGLRTPTRPR